MTSEGKQARAEYMREWRKSLPAEKEAQKEKYMREYMREYMRQWRKANPDKVKASKARYWNKKAKQAQKNKSGNGLI